MPPRGLLYVRRARSSLGRAVRTAHRGAYRDRGDLLTYLLTYLLHRRSQDALARVEAFIGGAKMEEARRRRGWRALVKVSK